MPCDHISCSTLTSRGVFLCLTRRILMSPFTSTVHLQTCVCNSRRGLKRNVISSTILHVSDLPLRANGPKRINWHDAQLINAPIYTRTCIYSNAYNNCDYFCGLERIHDISMLHSGSQGIAVWATKTDNYFREVLLEFCHIQCGGDNNVRWITKDEIWSCHYYGPPTRSTKG